MNGLFSIHHAKSVFGCNAFLKALPLNNPTEVMK